MKSKVVVVPCDSYDKERVYRAMKIGINELGGLSALINTDEKVLIKPNFLSAADPDKAVTTHPSVIEAMFRILSEEGYTNASYGDSPGHGSCDGAVKKLELNEVADKYGITRADMETSVLTEFPEGRTANSFHYCKGVVEADAIINLCKMKTHALERITGAVKNVYGFVCGTHKAAGHVKYPNPAIFARMLADIHRSTDIRLHVMDGIVAMEGNGPGSGDPTKMNVLVFSTDPVALDATFCHMVYLNPKIVPTCEQGAAMGIGTFKRDEVELYLADGEVTYEITIKELQEQFGNKSFDVDRTAQRSSLMGKVSTISTFFSKRPAIIKSKCVKCGICVNHCPLDDKAITFAAGKDNPPVYDYKKCIRCYCCQEMCPQKAIRVKGRL